MVTKKGLSERLTVEFNADFTIHERENYDDLGYCSAAELIELETSQFEWLKNVRTISHIWRAASADMAALGTHSTG